MSEMNKKFKVAGLGEILWDLLPQGKQLGGAPANFAYHAQMLGAEGYVISAIGKDDLGREIIDHINKIGLSSEFIYSNEAYPTGIVTVKIDTFGKPHYIIHTDVAWDFIPLSDSLLDLGRRLDAVCFGSLAQRAAVSRQTIMNLLKTTPEKSLRIFDINIRQQFYSKDVIEDSLKISNCLKLNEDEFPLLAGLCGFSGSEENIVNKFLSSFDLLMIALTKGEKGSFIYTKNNQSFKKSPTVQVKDTVGAGDAFTAALCIGLLNSYPIEQIHDGATRAAAFVCTQKGATPMLPKQLIAEISSP